MGRPLKSSTAQDSRNPLRYRKGFLTNDLTEHVPNMWLNTSEAQKADQRIFSSFLKWRPGEEHNFHCKAYTYEMVGLLKKLISLDFLGS